ncbi:unnamed protein product [Arabidopsis halleri]
MASSKIFLVASLLMALMFTSMITSSRAAKQFTKKQTLKPKIFRPRFPQFPRPGFPSNPAVPSFPQFPRPGFPTNPMPFPQFPRPGFPSNPTPGFSSISGARFSKIPIPISFPSISETRNARIARSTPLCSLLSPYSSDFHPLSCLLQT